MELKVGDEVWVLCYVPGHLGNIWCKGEVAVVYNTKVAINFADGTGLGYWPKNEVYASPDLSICKEIQKESL